MTRLPIRQLVLLLSLLAAFTPTSADGPTTTSAPADSYAEAVKAVRATVSLADDEQLAERMYFDLVVEQDAATAGRIADALAELGEKSSRAADCAARAMEIASLRDPRQADARLERVFQLRQKQYDLERSAKNRLATGEELIHILLDLAETRLREGRADLAEPYLRRALATAAAIQSQNRAAVQEAIRTLNYRAAVSKRAAATRQQLLAEPGKTDLRTALLTTLVVDLDQPADAVALLSPDLDETWRSYVPAAAQRPSRLPGDVAEELARWYASLSAKADPASLPTVLERRQAYLNQFLRRHPKDDDRRARAQKDLDAVSAELARLGRAPTTDSWALGGSVEIKTLPAVRTAVRRARKYLLAQQRPDGSWPTFGTPTDAFYHRLWPTALVAEALLAAGEDPRGEPLRRALWALTRQDTERTLGLASRICVLAGVRTSLRGLYARNLREDVLHLVRSSADGSFGLVADTARPTRQGSPFYTQYALRALALADEAGANVPRSFWSKAYSALKNAQNPGGGWGASPGQVSDLNSTASALNALLICLAQLGTDRADALANPTVAAGLKYFDERFNNGSNSRPLHYFTNLGRLGAARNTAAFAGTNWFDWACKDLLKFQGDDGSWAPKDNLPQAATALGVIFLSEASK